jgi:hypothetical protein
MTVTIGIGLKGYCAVMADYLGITPLAVYERQRMLVRLGVLPDAGPGRNKGVRASPATVAPLLIAGLFVDNLSELDDRFRRLLNAKPTEMERLSEASADQRAHLESAARQWAALGRKSIARTAMRARATAPEPAKIVCPITGASNFRNAVAALLASEALATQVGSVIINRSLLLGTIRSRDGRVSPFGTARSKKLRPETTTTFPGELVTTIARDLDVMSTVKEHSS